jgi:hypothetical protein
MLRASRSRRREAFSLKGFPRGRKFAASRTIEMVVGARAGFSGRAIIAGVVASLFALQVFVLAMSPHERFTHPKSAHPSVIALIEGVFCSAYGDEKSPSQSHDSHSNCCILCASCRSAEPPLQLAVLLLLDVFLPARSSAATNYLIVNPSIDTPTKRISSSSSRGPPVLS